MAIRSLLAGCEGSEVVSSRRIRRDLRARFPNLPASDKELDQVIAEEIENRK